MSSNVYARLYAQLTDLVPALLAAKEGDSFYAPPRLKGDIASYCLVSHVAPAGCNIQISHDTQAEGQVVAAPSLLFRANHASKTAELLEVEDHWSYEAAYTDGGGENPRRSQMNVYGSNNLAAMIMLDVVFRTTDAAVEQTVAAS